MSIIPLFLILFCSSALTAETDDAKHAKRGIVGAGGWIGIPNPHSYGHGQPWVASPSWREFKFPSFDLAHHGLYGGLPYGRAAAIPLPIGRTNLVKPVPVYITKHVVLEKPIPVPEPVYIEKPYHVPIEKVIPIPVEKIIHKPVPVPFPVPEAVPVPVERAVPIPVKHPVPVPVQQPYPVPVKQAFPVPVPVPYPIAIPPPISLYGPAALSGSYYPRGYGSGHLYPSPVHGPSLSAHFLHGYGHAFGHGFAPGFGHDFGHGHAYAYPSLPYVQHYAHGHAHGHEHGHHHGHGHEHKKRSKD